MLHTGLGTHNTQVAKATSCCEIPRTCSTTIATPRKNGQCNIIQSYDTKEEDSTVWCDIVGVRSRTRNRCDDVDADDPAHPIELCASDNVFSSAMFVTVSAMGNRSRGSVDVNS